MGVNLNIEFGHRDEAAREERTKRYGGSSELFPLILLHILRSYNYATDKYGGSGNGVGVTDGAE